MSERRARWKDRLGEEVTCAVCGEVRDSTEVDRMLWCESCREVAQARAGRIGWYVGAIAAAALAIWISLVVRPSRMISGAWIATIVAAGWLASKMGREVAYGLFRARGPDPDRSEPGA